jgi:hypothetical protein
MMDNDILAQLVEIKWLVVALVIGVLFLASVRTWIDLRRSGGPRELLRRSFADHARSLLEEGRAAELLALSQARFEGVPADAYAFWYHAQAAHRLGDIPTALQSIRKVGELQPEWREAYVNPFIRALNANEVQTDASGFPQNPSNLEPTKPH